MKVLLDETNFNGNQRFATHRLGQVQKSGGVNDQIVLKKLAKRYLPVGPSVASNYPVYGGRPLEETDSPFTIFEIEEVLHDYRSAVVSGGITNRLLRSLYDESIAKLTGRSISAGQKRAS